MSDPTTTAELHTPCRTRSVYLKVNGRRWGIEVEGRKSPRYVEVRLIGKRTRTWTHHAHPVRQS